MLTMTRKDYKLIAKALVSSRHLLPMPKAVLEIFANCLASDNPKFDRARFEKEVYAGSKP